MARHKELPYPSANTLRFAIRDSALSKIVRGQLNGNAVTWYETNVMFSHFPSNMSYYLVAVFELNFELGTWQGFHNYSI